MFLMPGDRSLDAFRAVRVRKDLVNTSPEHHIAAEKQPNLVHTPLPKGIHSPLKCGRIILRSLSWLNANRVLDGSLQEIGLKSPLAVSGIHHQRLPRRYLVPRAPRTHCSAEFCSHPVIHNNKVVYPAHHNPVTDTGTGDQIADHLPAGIDEPLIGLPRCRTDCDAYFDKPAIRLDAVMADDGARVITKKRLIIHQIDAAEQNIPARADKVILHDGSRRAEDHNSAIRGIRDNVSGNQAVSACEGNTVCPVPIRRAGRADAVVRYKSAAAFSAAFEDVQRRPSSRIMRTYGINTDIADGPADLDQSSAARNRAERRARTVNLDVADRDVRGARRDGRGK